MYQKPVIGIEPEAMELLQDYSWPGNVRELENIIQRAIILTHGNTISVDCLPRNLQEGAKAMLSASRTINLRDHLNNRSATTRSS